MKKEKGITLIELLATVSILFIITSIIFGVLISSNKNYRNVTEKVNLDQEANIILTTIKSYHQKQELHSIDPSTKIETYIIKYDRNTEMAYIGSSAATLIPLQKDNLKIYIKIDYTDFSGEKIIHPADPLYVYIKLINKQGQSYEIDTVIKQY